MDLTSMHSLSDGWHVPATRKGLRSWQAQRTRPLLAHMCRCPLDCTCGTEQLRSGNAIPIRHAHQPLRCTVGGDMACL